MLQALLTLSDNSARTEDLCFDLHPARRRTEYKAVLVKVVASDFYADRLAKCVSGNMYMQDVVYNATCMHMILLTRVLRPCSVERTVYLLAMIFSCYAMSSKKSATEAET